MPLLASPSSLDEKRILKFLRSKICFVITVLRNIQGFYFIKLRLETISGP
jgi:hypothetical protein